MLQTSKSLKSQVELTYASTSGKQLYAGDPESGTPGGCVVDLSGLRMHREVGD